MGRLSLLDASMQAVNGRRWVAWVVLLAAVLIADRANSFVARPLARAVVDNAGHTVIGALCWACTLLCAPGSKPAVRCSGCNWATRLLQRSIGRIVAKDPHVLRMCFEICVAGACSSLLDLDHFIAARSATLEGATHLSNRPFGHAMLFVLVVAVVAGCCCRSLNASWLIVSSLLTHQLRDATRRGMWFWPVGSSHPLPYPLYLAIVVLLPVFIGSRLERIEDDWSSGDESGDDDAVDDSEAELRVLWV